MASPANRYRTQTELSEKELAFVLEEWCLMQTVYSPSKKHIVALHREWFEARVCGHLDPPRTWDALKTMYSRIFSRSQRCSTARIRVLCYSSLADLSSEHREMIVRHARCVLNDVSVHVDPMIVSDYAMFWKRGQHAHVLCQFVRPDTIERAKCLVTLENMHTLPVLPPSTSPAEYHAAIAAEAVARLDPSPVVSAPRSAVLARLGLCDEDAEGIEIVSAEDDYASDESGETSDSQDSSDTEYVLRESLDETQRALFAHLYDAKQYALKGQGLLSVSLPVDLVSKWCKIQLQPRSLTGAAATAENIIRPIGHRPAKRSFLFVDDESEYK